ncbi:MAG TPA: EamA family transporter [Dehalococcoidia bacterium]|nr:EamA family transporter [Dehalococcoidia bacterium]
MPVDWVSIALISTAVFGVVNIIDSHLISRRMPSLQAFLLPASIFSLVYGLVIFYLFPLPDDIGIWPLMVTVASGIARTIALVILLYTLKKEEVSRVIPMTSTYPVFVAIIAVPLLGETLNYLQWIAIIIVVAGAAIVSTRRSPSGSTTWLGRVFFLLVGSSLLMAVANIATKYALTYMSFWNMYCITIFCMSGIFMLISLRPRILKELGNMKQRNSAITLLALNEILVVTGVVLLFWAMERGPVSLVSTIASSRPIFVVIYALILSRTSPAFLKWQSGKRILVLRLIAITMIVGGIAIIYLT